MQSTLEIFERGCGVVHRKAKLGTKKRGRSGTTSAPTSGAAPRPGRAKQPKGRAEVSESPAFHDPRYADQFAAHLRDDTTLEGRWSEDEIARNASEIQRRVREKKRRRTTSKK